jgi:hypothetical protein
LIRKLRFKLGVVWEDGEFEINLDHTTRRCLQNKTKKTKSKPKVTPKQHKIGLEVKQFAQGETAL